jgi:cyclin B
MIILLILTVFIYQISFLFFIEGLPLVQRETIYNITTKYVINVPIKFILPDLIKSPYEEVYFFSIVDVLLLNFLLRYCEKWININRNYYVISLYTSHLGILINLILFYGFKFYPPMYMIPTMLCLFSVVFYSIYCKNFFVFCDYNEEKSLYEKENIIIDNFESDDDDDSSNEAPNENLLQNISKNNNDIIFNNNEFLNNGETINNIKIIKNKKELEDSENLVKKAQVFHNNFSKRSTMLMKISHNPLQNIKNARKENNNNLFEIIEEKEKKPSRLTLLNNESNAITKGAISENKAKAEKCIIKDYFHSLIDDYGEDIFRYIGREENVNVCDYSSKDLFRLQDKKFINEKNRGIIFQWLVKNNNKWKLNDDTIFMAMNIMDRYISKYKVENAEFQLVGVSSYLIASKYEDIYPPYVDELSKICNFIYTTDDIIKKEYEILSGLDFDILYNSSYKFLTFLHSIVEKDNDKLLYLAQFILEVSLENIDILEFSQSKRALAALLLAKKIMKIKKSWNDVKLYYNYNENEIKNIQKKMIILLNNVMKSKNKNSVFEKFESSRYKSVSSILENMVQNPNNWKQRNSDDNKENNEIYNDENKPNNY